MAETAEETKKRFASEDALFAERKASGAWPKKTCAQCIKHTGEVGCGVCCCQRAHHFTGGLCLHCGFDERDVAPRPCKT